MNDLILLLVTILSINTLKYLLLLSYTIDVARKKRKADKQRERRKKEREEQQENQVQTVRKEVKNEDGQNTKCYGKEVNKGEECIKKEFDGNTKLADVEGEDKTSDYVESFDSWELFLSNLTGDDTIEYLQETYLEDDYYKRGELFVDKITENDVKLAIVDCQDAATDDIETLDSWESFVSNLINDDSTKDLEETYLNDIKKLME